MQVILVKPKDTADINLIMTVIGQIKGIDAAKIYSADGTLATIKTQISKDIADTLFKEA